MRVGGASGVARCTAHFLFSCRPPPLFRTSGRPAKISLDLVRPLPYSPLSERHGKERTMEITNKEQALEFVRAWCKEAGAVRAARMIRIAPAGQRSNVFTSRPTRPGLEEGGGERAPSMADRLQRGEATLERFDLPCEGLDGASQGVGLGGGGPASRPAPLGLRGRAGQLAGVGPFPSTLPG